MILLVAARRLLPYLMVLSVLAGCSGFTPYEPRNDREEGPEKGLFSRSEGELVIYAKDGKKDQTVTEDESEEP